MRRDTTFLNREEFELLRKQLGQDFSCVLSNCPTSKMARFMAPITGKVVSIGMRVLIAVLDTLGQVDLCPFEIGAKFGHFCLVARYVVVLHLVANLNLL